MAVAEIGGEELDEAPSGVVAMVGEQCGHAPRGRSKGSRGYGDDW
jgi:hypothetical protein